MTNQYSDAYNTGYEAYQQGEQSKANPYLVGTWEYDEWREGWSVAFREENSAAQQALADSE